MRNYDIVFKGGAVVRIYANSVTIDEVGGGFTFDYGNTSDHTFGWVDESQIVAVVRR